MANIFNKFIRSNSPHPMYGIRPGFNISDVPSYQNLPTAVFTDITVATVSPVLTPGARYIEVAVKFSSATTTCNVDLYSTVSGVDTLEMSVPNVSVDNSIVQFGNFEGININGNAFKIGISNLANAAALSVSYKVNG